MGEQKNISMDEVIVEVERSRLSSDVAEAIKAESGPERYGLDPNHSRCIVVARDQD